jgi:fibronectin-binding autotransporter adhesin
VQINGTLNLGAGGSGSGTMTNAGSLALSTGTTFTFSGTYSQTGTLFVPATSRLTLAGTFSNFSGSTLAGGTYVIGGTLQFTGANIVTNAGTIVLDGPASQIMDQANNDALANFATNVATSSFTIQNGRNFGTAAQVTLTNAGLLVTGAGSSFTVAGTFANVGVLVIGAASTFTVTGGFANFDGSTLSGGTYVITGTLRFVSADLRTNAATIVLDGPGSQIVDLSGTNALANFATNASVGSFTIQNGRNFATGPSVTFNNVGLLIIAAGSTFTVTAGFTNFAGTTLTGGTYVIDGTLQFTGANTETNAATIVLDGPTAQIVDQANNNALANFAGNAAAGRFTIQNGSSFTRTGAFSNAGTLIIGAGSTFTMNGAFIQTGTVWVQSYGTLILAAGGSNSGSFTVSAAGLVTFAAGTFTLNVGTTLSGDGLYQIAGATVSITDAVIVPNLELDSGALTGAAVLTITNSFAWTGGTMSGTGSTDLAPGSVFTISGAADKTLGGRTLNLGGTTTWSDSGNVVLANNAVISNQSGAVFIILNDQGILGTGTCANAGTLTKAAGTGTTTVDSGIAFANRGTVSLQSGTFNVAGTYTQSGGTTDLSAGAALTSSGGVNIQAGILSGSGTINASLTIQNGGTLSGSETINGNVTNAGQVNPGGIGAAGVLTINGNYTQTATGVLNVEIGGPGAGSGFDQLRISGTATLGGTLNVSLLNGYVPPRGRAFQILTFGSREGTTFATVNLDPAFLPLAYNNMDVNLTAS